MPQSIQCPSCRGDVAVRDSPPGPSRATCPRCGADLTPAIPGDPAGAVGGTVAGRPDAIAAGWLGRYRVVGPGRGRAWGFGPEVALDVVPPRWATDPQFVASWTLEALAAGAVRHPNLVRAGGVDVGRGRLFAVGPVGPGRPLADPAARADLDGRGRAAAVLHAARGLRAAHEQGVYHRRLDAGAIRVDRDGLVAVAGTGRGLASGTIAAEATTVAEDVAGLGRILAPLLAGASGDRAVSPGLATAARRLVDGDPRERPRDLGAVVRALEGELGVAGPLVPGDAEAAAVERALIGYQAAPLLAVRAWVAPGAAALLALVVVLMLASGRFVGAIGWVGCGALVAAALAAWRGWDARAWAGDRAARALAVVGRRDLGTLGVVAGLGGITLAATHFVATALIVGALAAGLAAAYHFGLDRPLAASRAASLARLADLVRGWRRRGYDEGAVRRYVAAAGGKHWEEIFAALFGLDALPPARLAWGADLAGARRPRFAPIRAWLLAAWDEAIARRGDDRARGLLGPILERDFEARGMHVLTARRKARRSAEAVVAVLGQSRRAVDGSVGLPLAGALRRAADHPEEFLASPEIAEDAEPPAWRASVGAAFLAGFGARARFILGVAGLAAAFTWMEQNALVSYEEGKRALLAATVEGDRARALDQARTIGAKFVAGVDRVVHAPDRPDEPMDLGPLPPAVARHLNGFALLAAGSILLASAFVPGAAIIPFAFLGASVPLAPRLVVPGARPLDPASLAAMVVGLVVFAVGMRRARRQGEARATAP